MKKLKYYLLFFSFALISSHVIADSPLTSTDFGVFQEHVPQNYDTKSRVLTNNMAHLLVSPDLSIETKLQLVNGYWQFPSSNNSALFLAYLANGDINKPTSEPAIRILDEADPDTIAIYAYLLALDDYFDVVQALGWASVAELKKPNSLAINMVRSLIEAQVALDFDWCKVYQVVENVRNNTSLDQDLSPQTIASIFEYIDIYKNECK